MHLQRQLEISKEHIWKVHVLHWNVPFCCCSFVLLIETLSSSDVVWSGGMIVNNESFQHCMEVLMKTVNDLKIASLCAEF
jgi:hypothetical protein